MSRCLMVLGPHRSGTSCVAGVLHHLGATSKHAPNVGKGNPKGHFEDPGFVGWNSDQIGRNWMRARLQDLTPKRREQYRKRIAVREKEFPIWTLKDPRLCFVARQIWDLFSDLRVVVIRRDIEASVQSHGVRTGMMHDAARVMTKQYLTALGAFLRDVWTGPVFQLAYEDLVQKPEEHVDALAAFGWEGLGWAPTDVQRGEAVGHVDPHLWHHR